ncbi:phospholipid/cholesterol/gamma-HCH transport system substrate-binding protein [Chitinophaga costaii]|uniref:Phospholipid/cholesterol/gamma-HCH transport system substrate-binding protein n=1 Tax=Chitinophaga costaii TaxID=1335309 RepID=A0A1C4BJ30_9BACT|nr:MlaD family protein [Chitinophaga costaii]PUZ27586.1 MCE family protein [Chitinophaga costaii]SCC06833.1 phospholipid/cholesterol/gamma-HCH transport system substrate-binding protein [Chitinophaga costaii]
MNASNKRAVTVGIFIFVGIAIIIMAVLTLGGQRKTFVSSVQVSALFKDINGLQAGNNIWYSGVKIGTVKKIEFTGSESVKVLLNVQEDYTKFIHSDCKAKIGSDGLIGNRIVVLFGGTPTAPALAAGNVLNVDNGISTDDIMNTLQTNNKNLVGITDNLKVISTKLASGEGSIGKLLNDESLYNALEAVSQALRQASSNTQQITANLNNYTAQLQKKGTLANDLVSDTVIFAQLRSTVRQLNQVASTANGVVTDLKGASSSVNTALSNDSSAVGVLLHDTASAENLRQIIYNLQTSTGKLDEDLEAAQHNFLLRGYFKKKAKAAKKAADAAVKQ